MVFREGRTKAVGTVVRVVPTDTKNLAKQKDKYNRMSKSSIHYILHISFFPVGAKNRGPKPPNNKPKDDMKVNELADKLSEM